MICTGIRLQRNVNAASARQRKIRDTEEERKKTREHVSCFVGHPSVWSSIRSMISDLLFPRFRTCFAQSCFLSCTIVEIFKDSMRQKWIFSACLVALRPFGLPNTSTQWFKTNKV